MAFQLLHLNNVKSCHVVDPRPLALQRFTHRLQRGFYHKSASIFMEDIVTKVGEIRERPVGHLQCFFSHELWANNDNDDDSSSAKQHATHQETFARNCRETQAWSWPPKGNNKKEHRNEHDSSDNLLDKQAATQTTPPTFQQACTIVQQANLIVGMHPDQAVDAIVDAALALHVSFFVVPCCTYRAEFPHRRLKNGQPVSTYEQLLDYLQQKCPDGSIQRHVLPFEGKNVCLYRVVVQG